MALRLDIFIAFFVCCILLSRSTLADSNQDLSNKEEIAFQQQLINLKYSAIKSIQVDGDIYDCIDFFRQPGFNHPFWKNTTIQMKHRLFMEAMKNKGNLPSSIGLKDGGCPYGTVPIKRIDEDDLAIAKTNSKIYLSNIEEEPGHHFAIIRTKPDPTRKMDGIQAFFSNFLSKGVNGSQYSSFRMTLLNGLDSLKVRFMVNHHLGPNSKDSVWTLLFKEESAIVSFWPSTVFGKLSEFGNEADWGGEVYSPLDQPSPAMGTGILPLRDNFSSIWSAHSTHIAVAYENSQSKFVNPSDAEVYESNPESYNIVDAGYWSEAEFGCAIVYDGPGGIKST
ncbi:hypothetical protein I3760_12G124200 [Carya illinoinensis]|nr:hypothetical protein I3760_12G124200 [Carya illinoinensis]